MSSALERYRKRIVRKVPIDGEEFTIRTPLPCENKRATALPQELHLPWILAFAMLEDSGVPMFSQKEDEADEEFAKRVAESLTDVPLEKQLAVVAHVRKQSEPPAIEDLVKNSGQTAKPV